MTLRAWIIQDKLKQYFKNNTKANKPKFYFLHVRFSLCFIFFQKKQNLTKKSRKTHLGLNFAKPRELFVFSSESPPI